MTAVILVADGARPDALTAAMDAGHLPALAALRARGTSRVITSVFPSVTGPAYVPFVMGIHPGEAGIPGIRWWDRAGARAHASGNARSYVGFEAMFQDDDLSRAHQTLFEIAPSSLAAFSPIRRGLAPASRLDSGPMDWPRVAWTHFRGDVEGWLRLEADMADRFATRIARERPAIALFAHFGADKVSHRFGHDAPQVLDALRMVDAHVARLTADAERSGALLDLIVVSDHGHSAVHSHDELVDVVRALGFGVRAHPFTFAGGDDVAVMVGGNAMAHLYLDLGRAARQWWPGAARKWTPLVEALLARESVELVLLPRSPSRCEVRSRARGTAVVERDSRGGYAYRMLDGDPLGLDAVIGAGGAIEGLDESAAYAITLGTDHPDSLVQVLALAGARDAGDVILSAAPGWDFRERWEPIPHRSTHGSLRREHLLVPLVTSLADGARARRTTDVFRLARDAAGLGG